MSPGDHRIPTDGAVILTFQLDDSGNVMGVEPSPFYTGEVGINANALWLMRNMGGGTDDNVALGTLDFREVDGRLGSLHLELVGLTDRPDGAPDIQIEPLTIDQAAVEIDIKPDSDQNTINLSSAGVIPVAIMSSAVFDATTVDPDTVSLAGARVRVVGRGNRLMAHIEDVNGDGLDDLLCQVETADFLIEPGDSTVLLEAETFDGIEIRSQDFIRIVPD